MIFPKTSSDRWVNNITRAELVGSENVYTTIEDLARWDQNFYDPKVGGEAVIGQMLKPGTLNNGNPVSYAGGSYGAGLRLGTYKGLKLVWHAGSSSSRSEYLRFPDQHFSVLCLCNTGNIDPLELARQVADIYLADLLKPEPPAAPQSPEKQAQGMAEVQAFIKEHAVSISEDKLSLLAGCYVNPDNGNIRRLLMEDGKLILERRAGVGSELAPTGENRFLMTGIPVKLELSFKEPWPGNRLMLVSTGEGTPLALVYAGPDSAKPTDLSEYAGTYQSAEADATITMVVQNNKLVLRAKGFEEPLPPGDSGSARGWYPLDPVCHDAFRNIFPAEQALTRGLVSLSIRRLGSASWLCQHSRESGNEKVPPDISWLVRYNGHLHCVAAHYPWTFGDTGSRSRQCDDGQRRPFLRHAVRGLWSSSSLVHKRHRNQVHSRVFSGAHIPGRWTGTPCLTSRGRLAQ